MSPRKAFHWLYRIAKADAEGIAYLGDTNDGNYALFASLLVVDGQPPAVVIEELEILKCPCCGEDSDLGDVTRAICLDEDGFAFRIDLNEGEQDLDLTDDEIELVSEAARRAAGLVKGSTAVADCLAGRNEGAAKLLGGQQ